MTIDDSLAIQPVEIVAGSVGFTGAALSVTGPISSFGQTTVVTGSTGTVGSDLMASTDVSAYRQITIQYAGSGSSGSAAFRLQGSNDNVIFTDIYVVEPNVPQFVGPLTNFMTGGTPISGTVKGSLYYKFARIRVTSNSGNGVCTISAFLTSFNVSEIMSTLNPVFLVDSLGNAVNGNQDVAVSQSANSNPWIVSGKVGLTGIAGVTFPVAGVTFQAIGLGVTFPQLGAQGITGVIGITGTGIGVTFPTGIGVTFPFIKSFGITGLIGITGFPIVGITGFPLVGITGAPFVGFTGVQSISLGSTLGKTVVMKTGSLTTSATTADQAILTYAKTAGVVFYLQYFAMKARIAAIASTATSFGDSSLEHPSGTKLFTEGLAKDGGSDTVQVFLSEPIPITGATIRIVCTPASGTTFVWTANFGGYEK